MASAKALVLPLVLGRDTTSLPYLAMGMLTAYLRKYQDGQLAEAYDIDPLLPAGYAGYPLKAVYHRAVSTANPVCLFSSYVWNHKLNIKVAEHVRKISPGALIVFGGPHVPKYRGDTEKFLQEHSFIDVAVLGEGEVALAEILTVFSGLGRKKKDVTNLHNVAGIVYSKPIECTRTPEHQNTRTPEHQSGKGFAIYVIFPLPISQENLNLGSMIFLLQY
jgi:hypothetical protein